MDAMTQRNFGIFSMDVPEFRPSPQPHRRTGETFYGNLVSNLIGGECGFLRMVRILVAEDNPADIYLLREALSLAANDVDLLVVSDGEEALEYVQRQGRFPDAIVPDLVVLDLNLPKSDGSDVLRCIRETPIYAGVPVVVLTSSDSPRDRKLVEALGANCFITKPSDLDAFLALGRTLIGFAGTPKLGGFVQARPNYAT